MMQNRRGNHSTCKVQMTEKRSELASAHLIGIAQKTTWRAKAKAVDMAYVEPDSSTNQFGGGKHPINRCPPVSQYMRGGRIRTPVTVGGTWIAR